MWKVNGFLYQLFPLLKRKACVSHLCRPPPCTVPGGQTVWKCITEAQSEMLPGWRQNQPGVWRANSVLTLAHSIKATISEPFDICHGHTFQGRIDQVHWCDLAIATQCAKSTVGRKTYSIHLGSCKKGNPAVHVWSWGVPCVVHKTLPRYQSKICHIF